MKLPGHLQQSLVVLLANSFPSVLHLTLTLVKVCIYFTDKGTPVQENTISLLTEVSVHLSLSLPRVIDVKVPLQPHQKYYITQYEELAFAQLTQMKDDYRKLPILTTSHILYL